MRRTFLQWSETHVERPAKIHQNAFIFVVPGVALLTPWMQKSLKIVENHRWGTVMRLRSGPPGGGPIRSVVRRRGTASDTRRVRPSTHDMPPSMIFDDFERILHPWREQSNTGNDKNERVFMRFRRSSDGVRF